MSTVRLLSEHKAEILAALAEARHHQALAHWSALRPIEEAAGLAWGELEDRWHRLHGRRAPEWQCAGCSQRIGGRGALTLADGCRVHLAGSLDCVIAYGERWRDEATTGLRALGLAPPEGIEL